MNLKYFGFTHIGLKRRKNEDTYIIHDYSKPDSSGEGGMQLFAVADGIGGNSCGELASAMACRELKKSLTASSLNISPQKNLSRLKGIISAIDHRIRQAAAGDRRCEHMGTTLCLLIKLAEKGWIIGHVGDSRIYRLCNGQMEQMTSDHTFVQEMIEEGVVQPDEAADHPLRNMLTRAVGTQEVLENAETRFLDFNPGDRFLISSDGLHKMVSDAEIRHSLETATAPEPCGRELLEAALKYGGKDNITAIIIFA